MGALAANRWLAPTFFGNRQVRRQNAAWLHMIGNVLVMVLSLFNAFVHSRDGWTAIVPTGLTLSAIVVLLLLFTGWQGWTMVYRHHHRHCAMRPVRSFRMRPRLSRLPAHRCCCSPVATMAAAIRRRRSARSQKLPEIQQYLFHQ